MSTGHKFLRGIFAAMVAGVCLTGSFAADSTAVEPTEAQVLAEYERARTNWYGAIAGQKEYDVQHILLGSRSDADAALGRIVQGEKFEDVARTVSKDPGSASKGGSLGWSLPSNFVEPFAKAMTDLGSSGISHEPVRTQFGWHVIRVLGVREPVFPPFEAVKERVRQTLIRSTEQWQIYDTTGGYAREVNVRSIRPSSEKTFFQYRERMAYGANPERTARAIPAVVDCARKERADVSADGAFQLSAIIPDTAQARQLKFVCERAEQLVAKTTPAAAPVVLPDVGLECDSPAPQFPAGFSRQTGFTGATVVVRGEVTAPAGAIGEAFVDVPSGYPAIDDAAVKAFRTMKCTTREKLQESRWVRRSFAFKLEDLRT
jgi:hypothetical protein